jgi:hypothetical protein
MAGTVSTFVCDLICNAVASTVTTVFVSVLYRDLRVARDGVDTDRIASVFE